MSEELVPYSLPLIAELCAEIEELRRENEQLRQKVAELKESVKAEGALVDSYYRERKEARRFAESNRDSLLKIMCPAIDALATKAKCVFAVSFPWEDKK